MSLFPDNWVEALAGDVTSSLLESSIGVHKNRRRHKRHFVKRFSSKRQFSHSTMAESFADLWDATEFGDIRGPRQIYVLPRLAVDLFTLVVVADRLPLPAFWNGFSSDMFSWRQHWATWSAGQKTKKKRSLLIPVRSTHNYLLKLDTVVSLAYQRYASSRFPVGWINKKPQWQKGWDGTRNLDLCESERR